MKVKLSKNQWEEMGKKAGWMKKQAQVALPKLNGTVTFSTVGKNQAYATGTTPISMQINTSFGTWDIPLWEVQDPDLQNIYQEILSNFSSDIQQAMKQPSQDVKVSI